MERDDQHPNVVNKVGGTVHGPVVQAGFIQGDVHVHHNASPVHVVVPVAAGTRRSFGVGAEVEVGNRTYLVHDHLVAEAVSHDGTAVHRQARVALLSGAKRRVPVLGWFRQIEDRHGGWEAGQALADEHDLAQRLGFPEVLQFHRGSVTTLVTVWPRERSGRPCDSLDVRLENEPVLDGRLRWLCGALVDLCTALGALHDSGYAHRALSPAGLIVRDDGHLEPRDLGLAVAPARPGEQSGDYQAPEQRRRDRVSPGTWTDVYQVAAIGHRFLTGRAPNTGTPLPVRAWNAAVPEDIAAAVDAALAPDPARRPDIRSLGGLLRQARDHIH